MDGNSLRHGMFYNPLCVTYLLDAIQFRLEQQEVLTKTRTDKRKFPLIKVPLHVFTQGYCTIPRYNYFFKTVKSLRPKNCLQSIIYSVCFILLYFKHAFNLTFYRNNGIKNTLLRFYCLSDDITHFSRLRGSAVIGYSDPAKQIRQLTQENTIPDQESQHLDLTKIPEMARHVREEERQ